ncbi:MAG: DUF1697 domain-containing protein [Pseudomonadota bacterium]|nr:DUF1697 domain-containing protein [Pseudomonadota bacterium]
MTRWVALFRGINVGKAKRVAMADLRALLALQGCSDVQTLLNSGNAVFDALLRSPATRAQQIQTAVQTQLGVASAVILKSAPEIDAVVAAYPFGDEVDDPSRTLVVLTADAASLAALRPIVDGEWGAGAQLMSEHALYLWCPDGILQSKAALALNRLRVACTSRNWATLLKIQALLNR